MEAKEVTIIGSGNVATHLAKAIKENISDSIHIHGRTEVSVKQLASEIKASYSVDHSNVPFDSQLYIISVSDDAVEDIVKNDILKEKVNNNLIVHTAGSIPMDILSPLSENYGVFYPLQTFSKFKSTNFKKVPLCLEANSGFNYDKLSKYALKISDLVKRINSEQRQYLHLAAVFANNFSNRMFAVAEEILKEHQIDFEILIPLLNETVNKIQKSKPSSVQTGPAKRNDLKVIEKHLHLLNDHKELKELYLLISQNIKDNN